MAHRAGWTHTSHKYADIHNYCGLVNWNSFEAQRLYKISVGASDQYVIEEYLILKYLALYIIELVKLDRFLLLAFEHATRSIIVKLPH